MRHEIKRNTAREDNGLYPHRSVRVLTAAARGEEGYLMKKLLAILLSLSILGSLFAFSGLTAAAANDHTGSVFRVYGNTFRDLSLEERVMTDAGDGTYRFTYHMNKGEVVYVYFQERTADDNTRVYSDNYHYVKQQYAFTADTAQDVVLVLSPDTYPWFSVIGTDIRALYEHDFRMYAIFNGQNQFSFEDGLMSKGSDGVYTVTYHDVQPVDFAVFDAQPVDDDPILGFYGYNVYPVTITDVCDVTVCYRPDYSGGYEDNYSENCRIWATGEYVEPCPAITLDRVRFNYNGLPSCKTADNVYYTVMENVPNETQEYIDIDFDNGVTSGAFYVDLQPYGWNPIDISANAAFDAELYPIYYNSTPFVLHSPYAHTNLKITLDATGLDYVTKKGAQLRVELFDMTGDFNMDCAVTIADATELQRVLAEFYKPTNNQKLAADVDGSGAYDIQDVTAIQRILAEMV